MKTPTAESPNPAVPESEEPTMVGPSRRKLSGSPISITLPDYEILEELGRGGMGVVYKARQKKLDRLVALKMILNADQAGMEEKMRFDREARAIARLAHPNIVKIFDIGEVDGKPYFSLELISGGTLCQQLGDEAMSPMKAAHFVELLARAMHAAHQADVIHRDLKPGNILITEDGAPKITDFGLAKHLKEATHTVTNAVLGTPSYMAPEQASDSGTVGPPADIYALGAILYECLTGCPPFWAPTAADTLLQVISRSPTPPSRTVSDLPRDLETICLKCLEKEPNQRYQSASILADELKRVQQGEPIHARPVGKVEKLWRWAKRNPALALVSSLLLILLLTASIVGPLIAIQYRDLAEEKAQATSDALRQKRDAEINQARAEAAEKDAIRAKETAEQNSAFLTRLFREADPFGLAGSAFTAMPKSNPDALTILARGEKYLAENQSLKDRPLARATMLDTIGSVHSHLGHCDRAEVLLLEAWNLRKKHLKAPHAELATSLHNLGFLRFGQARWKEAITMLDQAFQMRRSLHGEQNPLTVQSMHQLGIAHSAAKNVESATRLLTRLVEIRTARLKELPTATEEQKVEIFKKVAEAYITRALHYYRSSQKAAAAEDISAFQELARLAPDNKIVQMFSHFLRALVAEQFWRQFPKADQQREIAEKEHQKALQLTEEVLGKDHYIYIWIEDRVARLCYSLRRYSEAEDRFRHVAQVVEARYGDRLASVPDIHYSLARAIIFGKGNGKRWYSKPGPVNEEQKKNWTAIWDDAEQQMRRAVRVSLKLHGESDQVSRYRQYLGYVLRVRYPKKHEEAEAVFRKDLAYHIKAHGPTSETTVERWISLLRVLRYQEKYDQILKEVEGILAEGHKLKWTKYQQARFIEDASNLARKGNHQGAIVLINEAVRAGYKDLRMLRSRKAFKPLQRRKDFQQLLRGMRN